MDFGALDLRHLRLVRAVVEEGTLTAAARRLALSQPALSHQLRDAEDRLGVDLFERRGRSLVLTQAGDRVLASARIVLGEVERTEADLAALAAGRQGTLRVATECSTTYHWLPGVQAAYGAAWPDVVIELGAQATERPGDALAARELDVAVLTITDDLDERVALTPLFEDEVVAVVAAGHPWADLAYIEPLAFEAEHVYAPQSCMDRDCILGGVLAPLGIAPARVTAVPISTEAAVGMVTAGLGITTMARWAVAPYLERGGLAAIPVTEAGVHRTWYAAVRDEPQPPYVEAFVDALRGAIQPLVEETSAS